MDDDDPTPLTWLSVRLYFVTPCSYLVLVQIRRAIRRAHGMSAPDITQLLQDFSAGNPQALDRLFPLVYSELRRVAHRQLGRERAGHTLNTTALVHEAYLKLVGHPPDVDWKDRVHFFAVAGRAMRQILVNYAKAKGRAKRGGGIPKVPLEEAVVMAEERAEELIVLDEALERLGTMNERQVRVVECRFFGGLTIEETAEVLGVSVATINRDWTTARLWLHREVRQALR